MLTAGGPLSETQQSSRLPRIRPRDLTDAQREVYEAVASPARLDGPFAVVDDDGCLTGPFNAMLHAPAVGWAVQHLGSTLRFNGVLPDRTRELVICAVAAAHESGYEWHAHSRVAAAAGVTGKELEAVRAGKIPHTASAAEAAALALTAVLLHTTTVSEDIHREALTHHGHQGVVELAVLVGYYRLLAGVLATADANNH